ncbi:cell wall-binding repeat-containing protein [Hoyosella sp. YIM 151337]|uniref:cell wall-binding repeat-containing protein n=1 Tax=Hoyosella sp. YIM 151337 TaxID=2992742 RepID=UPI002236A0C6|nr:cell wall-binding repeat-containing protein [Hoyosella sp. YIM 151337]MCW4355152.1 cell wall-binding repeat-containing protein [Hoyosella sp. YIM 151337]
MHDQRRWITVTLASAIVASLAAGCTIPGRSGETPPAQLADNSQGETDAETGDPLPEVVRDGENGVAYAASERFFSRAPFVVVAPADQPDAVLRGASLAVATSVPLLVSGPPDEAALARELTRLDTSTVVAIGGAPVPDTADVITVAGSAAELESLTGLLFEEQQLNDASDAAAALSAADGENPVLYSLGELEVPNGAGSAAASEEEDQADGAEDLALPDFGRGNQAPGVTVLAAPLSAPDEIGRAEHLAGVAVARAAGAEVIVLPVPDIRATGESVDLAREIAGTSIMALGSHFGSTAELRKRFTDALSVPELPGGGQLVYPGRRMIALYGHPGVPAMGVLGEQGPEDAIARARDLAERYEALSGEPVIPALEIIVTVASVAPGADNQYSNVSRVEDIQPWVDAARDEGTYIVLDLQPGRTDFLTQAKLFEELLKEPHVGLALDPEWRLRPDQVHLRQVGQVDASEVNEVIEWLADLTAEHSLPQKLLVLHQFQMRMITNRDQLETTREEVAVLIHADGHGVPAQKMDTWNTLKTDLQDDIWLGWKNFYDEDLPTFTPDETMAVDPAPWFVSYQ